MFTDYGHYNSALKQYVLAQESKDDTIFFVEDDYLWQEGAGDKLASVVKELGIVSPYDNPDFYSVEPFKSRRENLKLIDNQHWRSIISTTMTFAIRKDIFMKHKTIFEKWGPSDSPLWQEAKEMIWCPIPTIATHFVAGKLAPSVDWGSFYRR